MRSWHRNPVFLLHIFLAAAYPTANVLACGSDSSTVLQAQVPVDSTGDGGAARRYVLDPIIVSATRLPAPLEQGPASISFLNVGGILGSPSAFMNLLSSVPGLLVQNQFNFAQDLRISLRGFGARSSFGVRGIQILEDGLPLTLPDGQSQVDEIDFDAVERIQVVRGPSSSLYGNGSGGVINLQSKTGAEPAYLEYRTMGGNYGLLKTSLLGGFQTSDGRYFASLTRMTSDGFRAHSNAESWKLNGRMQFFLNRGSQLTFTLSSVYSPQLLDPGGLTLSEAQADPGQASALNLRDGTGEKVRLGRIGIEYQIALSASQQLDIAGYYGRRELDNAIPYRFVNLQRELAGGRVQWDVSGSLFGTSHQLFAGTEAQFQLDDRLNLDNVAGSPGDSLLLDQREQVRNFAFFAQEQIQLTEALALTLGTRYDQIGFLIADHLLRDGNDSGSKSFRRLSSRGGLALTPSPLLQIFCSISQSFETPTSTEIVNRPGGGGGINPEVAPQTAISYELGVTHRVGELLAFNASCYYISLHDELIAFRDFTDRVYYRNAGRSHRAGGEAEVRLHMPMGIELKVAYSYLRALFDGFQKGQMNLAGNYTPGLPAHHLFGKISYVHPSGFFVSCDASLIGRMFADDENRVEVSPACVANVDAGVEISINTISVRCVAGLNNVLDSFYYGNIRINANRGRYFEPAPGISASGGVLIRIAL